MKCFSILLCFFSYSLLAVEFTLSAQSKELLSQGDIAVFLVTADRDLDKIESYKNTRIHNFLYVLEVNQIKGNYYLSALISEKTKNEQLELNDTFIIQDIVFKKKDLNLSKDFNILENKYQIIRSDEAKIVFFLFLFLVIVLLLRFWITKRKLNNRKRQFELKVKEILEDANERASFELLYQKRGLIHSVYPLSEDFKVLYTKLNDIQYKKEWSLEEEDQVKELYRVAIKEIF